MKKVHLLFLVLATFSMCLFISCGGDDDSPEPPKETQNKDIEDETIDPYTTPLTLEAIDWTSVSVHNEAVGNIIYRINNGEQQIISPKEFKTISISKGDKLSFYGDNARYYKDLDNYSNIKASDCYIYGNIMSLINSKNFVSEKKLTGHNTFSHLFELSKIKSHPNKPLVLPATSLTESCYSSMFSYCKELTIAPELPANNLTKYCYANMFYSCDALTKAPELPATNLAEGCYSMMFGYCTSLTTAPSLPATVMTKGCYEYMFTDCSKLVNVPSILPALYLSESCYYCMFKDCVSLIKAPELPATTLPDYCYYMMFNKCISLNYVKCLAKTLGYFSTYNWLYDVSAVGTFIKDKNSTAWKSGKNYIPEGWSIINNE